MSDISEDDGIQVSGEFVRNSRQRMQPTKKPPGKHQSSSSLAKAKGNGSVNARRHADLASNLNKSTGELADAPSSDNDMAPIAHPSIAFVNDSKLGAPIRGPNLQQIIQKHSKSNTSTKYEVKSPYDQLQQSIREVNEYAEYEIEESQTLVQEPAIIPKSKANSKLKFAYKNMHAGKTEYKNHTPVLVKNAVPKYPVPSPLIGAN